MSVETTKFDEPQEEAQTSFQESFALESSTETNADKKQRTKTSKPIHYVQCKCGNVFATTECNKIYCNECIKEHRKNSSRRSYHKAKVRMDLCGSAAERNRERILKDGTAVLLPAAYIDSAELKEASALSLTYGKYQQWKEKHLREYGKWLDALAQCYIAAPNEPAPTPTTCRVSKAPAHGWDTTPTKIW
ncbi:MAG: hypothetical protein RR365_15040 [Bacteroides sp.]